MIPFLEQCLTDLNKTHANLSEVIFILPSQRAGSFFKNKIAETSQKPAFLPKIYSIETFIQELSTLQIIDATTALFKLYEAYLKITEPSAQEDFETFSGWGQTIIQDFNEIDRYLIDAEDFFSYLSNIKDTEHWYLTPKKTGLVKSYLEFWRQLPKLYKTFKAQLLDDGKAYQGLAYRIASETVKDYANTTKRKHSFIGFNALNNAEQLIINTLNEANLSDIFWDIDRSFFNDTDHDASYFIRNYFKSWPSVFKERTIDADYFSGPKTINLIGTPKKVGQAKIVAELLFNMNDDSISKTAVVLGDEGLLLPVLNSIPSHIKDINITMGLPLEKIPLASFFELLFSIQRHSSNGIYYKTVLEVFSHPSIQHSMSRSKDKISHYIHKENRVSLTLETVLEHSHKKDSELVNLLFSNVHKNPKAFVNKAHAIIQILKSSLTEEQTLLREYLFRFNVLFNKLETLLKIYTHVTNLSMLHLIYKDMLSKESLDFIGKKHKGLQLMGVLETRVLDFENIIITSVNEGILPSGKSTNSYLPYDLKKEYGLPTYKEKDAVYAYHFYHMLQRAKNINIIYNTEPGDLNSGEKSRFITQLEVESKHYPNHAYTHKISAPKVPKIITELRQIEKTSLVLQKLKDCAKSGFSPSALTLYMRNPVDFYYRYVLGVKDVDEVEETVAYNTLGTVIHEALEKLYSPYIDTTLTTDSISAIKKKAANEIINQFAEVYSKESIKKGKNLLILEVAKRYVSNFLDMEKQRIKNGEQVVIKALEKENLAKLQVEELDFPVFLKGTVDRVETVNGKTRIIDYKTGRVDKNKVKVDDWEELNTEYDKFSKPFQILQYAYMMNVEDRFSESLEAGIISFKNMKSGFMPFSNNKNTEITQETFNAFEVQLKALIIEICNPDIPFTEKEIPESYF